MKQKILQKTAREPFEDARFTLTEEGKSLLLLFSPYRIDERKPEEGKIRISAYYPVAQQAYLGALGLVGELKGMGVGAKLYHKNGLKRLAAQARGFRGKNTLFYHPEHGSFVNIQGIVLDIPIEADENTDEDRCTGCGLCAKACPTNAITGDGFARESCIRHHFGKPEIPPQYGQYLYQVMGCERCQAACPVNQKLPEREHMVHEYDLIGVLEEKHTKEIKKLIGTNFGTRTRILNQAIYYALNNRYLPAIPAMEALRLDEQAGAAARHALAGLGTNESH